MAGIYAERLRRLRSAMRARNLSALYLTASTSRQYLTGFTGTAGAVLIVSRGRARFFTDFRYTERAQHEVDATYVVEEIEQNALALLKETLRRERIRRLGIEDLEVSIASYRRLEKALSSVQLLGIGTTLLEERAVKDAAEIEILRQAIAATDKVFGQTVRWLRHLKRMKRLPTEEAVAWKVRDIVHTQKLGELAFETIVASGPNAARPHHEPTAKRLRLGEMVIIDLGVKVGGYHADMTRTVFLGPPTAKQRAMYVTTLRAQTEAIRYLRRGGRSAGEADRIARAVIDKKFPGSFGHALGHGVGLEIHEYPTLASKSKDKLKPGMIFSIEPGVYLPGEGGVRIEDLVSLEKRGCAVLSKSFTSLGASSL